MAKPSTCDPCCNPGEMSRSDESYRASVLKVLCDIKASTETLITNYQSLEESFDAVQDSLQTLISILNPGN